MSLMEKLLANPEFIGGMVSLFSGIVLWGGLLVRRGLARLQAAHEETKADVARAATAAESAAVQVNNTHATNLRDDLDRVIAGLERVQFSIDESDAKDTQWREDHAKKHDEERRDRADRDTRNETQIDMLRRDVQQLTEQSAREHELLHQRINRIKEKGGLD